MTITANMMNASGEEVQIINNVLPRSINLDLIKILSEKSWRIGFDINESRLSTLLSGNYRGFTIASYDNQNSYDDFLNIYANIIYKKILEQLNIDGNLLRFYWNMYYRNHNGRVHKDSKKRNYISIIYNLHTTDGGTQINNKFYPDINGQAKIFNSFIDHKGFGPKKDNVRFNLNIVFEKI
jgi:hypothetical protein